MSTTIKVAEDEDVTRRIVAGLSALHVPATTAKHVPVDLVWSVGDGLVMGDVKTAADLIASVADGRLHNQTAAMHQAKAWFPFILLVGPISKDGITVGYGTHAWAIERFDEMLVSLQEEGIYTPLAASEARVVPRIASLYMRLGKGVRGSWHAPVKRRPDQNQYYDRTYRDQVSLLLALPGMGETRAEALLRDNTLMEIIGQTEESLAIARARWVKQRGIGQKLAADWEEFFRYG